MKPTFEGCALVVRQLRNGAGVTESSFDVSSLEHLFDRCMSLADEHLLERLVLEGGDGKGRRRVLTFTFQSDSDRD